MVAFRTSFVLTLGLALSQVASAGIAQAKRTLVKRYSSPPVGSTWDYPLGYSWHSSNAISNIYFYSVDLFDTSASDIAAAKANGHYIACYFSAGTQESWRSDANSFPPSSIGNNVDGWAGEKWVDTNNAQLRSNVMAQRIALAKQKGCQAIDPDNTDGYDNDTGFSLTQNDAVNYVQWLCNQAHSKDMACGLKNNGAIVARVVSVTEFVINEQCVEFSECNLYKPCITAGKPVFHVEYTEDAVADPAWKAQACNAQGNPQFSTIIKHQNLNNYRESC